MKKTISLFLVLSLILLSMPLTAKEKKGADLLVRKSDGTEVKGELIVVKKNSLLLMEKNSGVDVDISFEDVRSVTIIKKSQALKQAGFGFLAGTGLVLVEGWGFWASILYGVGSACFAGFCGALMGADETFQKKEINLQDLRKKARVQNFQ
jgi:hypothetical protein